MTKINKIFMAFGESKASEETRPSKKYIGIAPVYIQTVNPNKTELEALLGRSIDKDPVYLSKVATSKNDPTLVDSLRLDFYVKTNEAICGVEYFSKVTFFLKNVYEFNADKTKVKVVDAYNRTAWASVEDAKAGTIPTYKNGPARIAAGFRPLYVGEEDLSNFLQKYLGIEKVDMYKDGNWTMKPSPEKYEFRFEDIASYFSGNIAELKSILQLQPQNRVKVMFGINNTENGSYQTIFTRAFMYNSSNNTSEMDRKLAEFQEYNNTHEYATTAFKEYDVEATNITKNNSEDLPPDTSSAPSPWGRS